MLAVVKPNLIATTPPRGGDGHWYLTPDGRLIPSVTTVLKGTDLSPEFPFYFPTTVAACQRGQEAHELTAWFDAAHLSANGYDSDLPDAVEVFLAIDSSVRDEVRGYCNAWTKMHAMLGWQIKAIELVVESVTMGFAGTIDRVVFKDGRYGIVDLKTIGTPGATPPPSAALQTAGYAMAFVEMYGIPVVKRWLACLYPNGEGKLIEVPLGDLRRDCDVFRNAISLFNWRVQHGYAV